MPLSEAQLAAVSHGRGPALVIAGPGSGKTTVIVRRVCRLLDEGEDPRRILVMTFTRAAAGEMRTRCRSLSSGRAEKVTFGTFHSVFWRMLRTTGPREMQIIPQGRARDLMRDILKDAGLEGAELAGAVLDEISRVKNCGISLKDYHAESCPDPVFLQAFKAYHEGLSGGGFMDYDDMLSECLRLFRDQPDVLARWRERFTWIMIDEYQDINPVQNEIVRLLAAPADNLFAVGDDDQSIYRFRGAEPSIMLGFPDTFPGTVRYYLTENYRSVPSVVRAAGCLISHNTRRFPKTLKSTVGWDAAVHRAVFADTSAEVRAIRDMAVHCHEKGIPWREMAVLFRTNRLVRPAAESFARDGIPCRTQEQVPNLYEHWIAGDILTYLFLAAGSTARADYLRIINRPLRYLGRKDFPEAEVDLDALRRSAEGTWKEEKLDRLADDLKRMRKMDPFASVTYVRKKIGYDQFLEEYASQKGLDAGDLFEILDELQEASGQFFSLHSWLSHIREYTALLAESSREDAGEDSISLMTMHMAKGKEYTAVFIPGLNEGVIPHKKSRDSDSLEEERRLLYVAMTRAKRELFLSCVKKRGARTAQPSRFWQESGSK